jgi:hypothetical protein
MIHSVFETNETAHRFIIATSKGEMKIFNIEKTAEEFSFSSRLEIVSCIEFMPFRGLFLIGGSPKTNFFGMEKKYRTIRFYRMDSLQEKPKYKIFALEENEFLKDMVYSDNSDVSKGSKMHIRVNNILAVTMIHVNSKGERLSSGGRIIFLFFDRMNRMTVLLTFDSLALRIIELL